MIRVARCSLLLVVVAAWLAACGPAPTTTPTGTPSPTASPTGTLAPTASPSDTPSVSPPAATTVTDGANGISFERPANWTRSQPNEHMPWVGGPLIYLSTDPLLPTCATFPEASPNPPDAQGMACAWPLTSLSANGVFVSWVNGRILTPLPSTGEVIAMNGETARIQIERPGYCAQIGADETIIVGVPIGQPTPLSNTSVIACLRGPDLATAEAQARAMLASALVGR